MHRNNLTVRRFGPMSFGIGYFEDGVWIDHSTSSEAAADALVDAREPLDAIHEWYGAAPIT